MTTSTVAKKKKPAWVEKVAPYSTPKISPSIWQMVNSFGPYFGIILLMLLTFGHIPYILTLLMAPIAAGFAMRIFIIQHDCGHGSFFKSKRANALVGSFCGVLTLTPYEFWRMSHAIHHAHNGDLNHRGTGDVYTMTFKEYREASPRQRLGYRIYRHPLMMFVFGPVLMFTVLHRAPFALKHARTKAGRQSIIRTDIAALVITVAMVLIFGLVPYFAVYLPVIWVSATVGVWMFFVQHQFEDAYWSQDPDWDYADAALKGSSYYKLPKVLQWFSGNIGLHHIHHLSPRIPNYLLQKCHDENPEFQEVVTLTLMDSVRIVASNLALWDGEQEKLISFKEAHRMERAAKRQLAVAIQEAPATGTD